MTMTEHNPIRQRMRRGTFGVACAAGGASLVLLAAIAVSTWGRADSIAPDLSGIQAQIAAALSQVGAAQTAATTAQQAATTSAAAAQTAQTAAASVSSDFVGSATVAQVQAMSVSANAGKRVFVTDLGGGAGPVYSTGSCFKRLSPSVSPTVVQASANVTGQALTVSSLIQMTAPSSLLANVNVAVTGLCPGDVLTVYMPNGVLTAAGTLGVSLNATSAITVTGVGSAYSADFLWTGTSALKLRGGPVQ